MATYYKGTLFLNSELNSVRMSLVNYYAEFVITSNFKKEYFSLTPKERKFLDNYLEEIPEHNEFAITNDKIIRILDKLVNNRRGTDKKCTSLDIIYELIKDEDGIIHGRELHTGLIFPCSYVNRDDVKIEYVIYRPYQSIQLKTIYTYEFPCLDLCEAIILDRKIANQNEVLEYENRFKGIGKRRRRRKFENEIRGWYNKNVYNREVVPCIEEPKKKEDRVSQSSETKVMASIEYLLIQMEKANLGLYTKYQKEYEELLNGLNDEMGLKVIPSTLLAFHSLEASIKVDLFSLKHNANNILEYLSTLQKEYLVNILTDNEKETLITFSELEKINELFLKAKSRYGLLEQRNILKKIAFLYLMELIENIDNIDELDLQNSYFVDSLKDILVHIEVLRKLGIIKSNVLIDLTEDLNIQNILEIIKTIEFNKFPKEESLELIKKL